MRIWAQALAAETEGGGKLQGLFNIPAGALSRGQWRLRSAFSLGHLMGCRLLEGLCCSLPHPQRQAQCWACSRYALGVYGMNTCLHE